MSNGKISGFYVMHVPGFDEQRDENVVDLQARLSPIAPVSVMKDKRRAGVLFTYRRCLHAAIDELDSTSDWVVILQDDATPVGLYWQAEMEAALKNSPHPFVSLCHFNDWGLKGAKKGYAYNEHSNVTWGQAIAYRRDILEDYWKLVDGIFERDPFKYVKWDDALTTVYNLLNGTLSCYTSRAIFTHLNVKSTLNHVPGKHRRPLCTIDDPEYKNIAWNSQSVGSVSMPVDPRITELAERMADLYA